mgnify:CR=1 FL=1
MIELLLTMLILSDLLIFIGSGLFLICFFISLSSYLRLRYISLMCSSISLLLFFIGMLAISLDPLINDRAYVLGLTIDYLDFIFISCVSLAVFMWLLALNYLYRETLSPKLIPISSLCGMIILGELYGKFAFSIVLNGIIGMIGLTLFSIFVIEHIVKVISLIHIRKMQLIFYFYLIGFSMFIIGGILIAMGDIALILMSNLFDDLLYNLGAILVVIGLLITTMLLAFDPKILIMNFSRPIAAYFVTREGTTILPFIFSTPQVNRNHQLLGAMMTSVSSITREIIGRDIPLRTINHGKFSIIISSGERIVGYLLTEHATKILRESLTNAVKTIEKYLELVIDSG